MSHHVARPPSVTERRYESSCICICASCHRTARRIGTRGRRISVGAITGRGEGRASALPMPNVEVSAPRSASVRTDSVGKFLLAALSPGRLDVSLSTTRLCAGAALDPGAADDTTEVDVTLDDRRAEAHRRRRAGRRPHLAPARRVRGAPQAGDRTLHHAPADRNAESGSAQRHGANGSGRDSHAGRRMVTPFCASRAIAQGELPAAVLRRRRSGERASTSTTCR